jgi:uncharacterized protein
LRLLSRFFAAIASAQTPNSQRQLLEYTRSHCTKYEYRIPMRDGAHLFTAVYVPRDDSHKYPIMLQRTPYWSALMEGITIAVCSALRNSSPARASFSLTGTSAAAVADVSHWRLRRRSFERWMGVDHAVRGVKARVRNAPLSHAAVIARNVFDQRVDRVPRIGTLVDIFRTGVSGFVGRDIDESSLEKIAADAYHFGAFFPAANFGFFTAFTPRPEPARPQRKLPFDYGTPDQYEFYRNAEPLSRADELYFKGRNEYWNDLLKHTSYDQFWRERALSQWMKNITPAVLLVGGWFDAEDLGGTVKMFRALEENQPDSPETFVMGPWSHGGWSRGDGEKLGDLHFNVKTAEYFRKDILDFSPALRRQGKRTFPGRDYPPDALLAEGIRMA